MFFDQLGRVLKRQKNPLCAPRPGHKRKAIFLDVRSLMEHRERKNKGLGQYNDFSLQALRKSVEPRLAGELAWQPYPDPALAQALPVPVGHSDSVAVRTSRPPGHAPTFIGWAQ